MYKRLCASAYVQVPMCKCLCASAYVQVLKQQVAVGQWRYYEQVIDAVPGVQCPGCSVRSIQANCVTCSSARRAHAVFCGVCAVVLAPDVRGCCVPALATESFIRLHDEAFRYFGGVTEACVYDQTKMVVISTGSSLVNGISCRNR